MRDPANDGYAVIGSGTYCTVEVEVQASVHGNDAIVVGDETWFLSRSACSRARNGRGATTPGCSDMAPRR